MNQKDYDILRLLRSNGVGSATFQKLIKFFETSENAIKNIDLFKTKTKISLISRDNIDKEIEECEKIGAKIITYTNPKYPKNLREIIDFPPVITILGNIDLLNKEIIAIIGSRNASANGCNFTKKIAKELGQNGYVIISGMANGIDAAAHLGSIDSGAIAVLGGGIDNIYPKNNEYLYNQIKENGCLVSENSIGCPPKAENFPLRNRIVSALAKAVVVIEASFRSGALNTARIAIEQGKEIMVAPGNPYDPRCEGSNNLIKDGAFMFTNVDDILYNLNDTFVRTKEKSNNVDISEEEKEIPPDDINRLLLSKLNATPIPIELLGIELNIKIDVLFSAITELELEGKVAVEYGSVRKILEE
ncbi:MAG: DNA-processing protein DprA [Rickettsiales bacterium]|jgi:DNA processing protein|nr:DNA-processing protein DprA [Rickettsiales bacterium]